MNKVYLTPEGYAKLKTELDYLKGTRRREITQAIQTAREYGDLSENAEYEAAKEEQAKLELRIHQLEDQLSQVQMIDSAKIPAGKISVGQRVRLLNLKTQEELEYILVAPPEADVAQKRISVTSPIGKGLLGHQVNEEIEINIPAGSQRYRVLAIERA